MTIITIIMEEMMAINPDDKVCQFIIVLEDVRPEIWRRLLIPEGFTLAKVHTIVQIAMTAGLPYTALRDAILTHPTMAEGLAALFRAVPARP